MANMLDILIDDIFKPKAHDVIDSLLREARESRPKYRENVFNQLGTKSTHLAATSDNYAFPMLFPKDPTSKTTTSSYDDWIEYPEWAWKQAMDEAEKRGELYNLGSPEKAEWFAKEIGGHN